MSEETESEDSSLDQDMNQNSWTKVERKCKSKNNSFNSKYLNDDNHVKNLVSKYEQLQKELNEVKNKQQEQDGRLDKSQERLDNHEGKLNSIWEGNALLKENIPVLPVIMIISVRKAVKIILL